MNSKLDIVVAVAADAAELLALQKAAFLQEAQLYQEFTMGPVVERLSDVEKDLAGAARQYPAV